MAFIEADISSEREELRELIKTDITARRAYEEFQARIALQHSLAEMRKARNMTQGDVAMACGLSQQAVSRIEKCSGTTVTSLIRYLNGIGCHIEIKRNEKPVK